MGKDTSIQWCHHTFNGHRGCVHKSLGCLHCYAEAMAKRNPKILGVWGANGTRVVASEATWKEPLKWDKEARLAGERHRVFSASLADVFEDWVGPMVDARGNVLHYNSAATWWVPEETLHGPIAMNFVRKRLFSLVESTPNLDWLILTKRPGVAANWWRKHPIPANLWQGTSVEDQATANERIPILLKIPATVRFLSMEPLIGPVQVGLYRATIPKHREHWPTERNNRFWVIVGGESGGKARPFDIDWARSIRDECEAAGVPFFMKQLGSNPVENGKPLKLKDHHGGDMGEWPQDLRVREFPNPDRRAAGLAVITEGRV